MECVKQFAASAIMFISILALNNQWASSHYLNGGMDRNIALLGVCGVSIVVFFIVGKVLNMFKFLGDMKAMDKNEK